MAAFPFLDGFELPALPLTHPGSQVTIQERVPLEPSVIFSLGLVKRRRKIQTRGYEINFGIFLSYFSASLKNSGRSISPRTISLRQAIRMYY